MSQCVALSPLVFFRISTNFTSTLGVPHTSLILKIASIEGSSEVEPRAFTPQLNDPPTLPLRPVIPSNASPPSYYRGCWHEVSRGFFSGYRHYRPR